MNKNLPIMKIESLTLSVLLIVVVNLILGVILAWPLISPKSPMIPPSVGTILVMIFFFSYYLLLLFYLAHYVRVFKEYFKGNEIKFIIYGSVIGLIGLAIFSFLKLGVSQTLSWLVPTAAVVLLDVIIKFFNKKDKSKDDQDKRETKEKKD